MKIVNVSKSTWVRPEVKKIAAGAAESLTGLTADGGGTNQGS